MNRTPYYLAASSLILFSLSPCPAQNAKVVTAPKVKEQIKPQELYGPIVAANNQFAIKFFKAAYQGSPQENVLTAPCSLSYAFALERQHRAWT